MPASIDIKMKPTAKELKRRHDRRLKELKDLTTPMRQASTYLDRWVQQNFKTEGGKGEKWQPFKVGGRYKNGKIDTSAKLLQDTGRLRASFLPFATRKNAGIGSDLPYSEAHEKGLGHLPKRRMLPLHSEVDDDLRDIIEDHVGRAIND